MFTSLDCSLTDRQVVRNVALQKGEEPRYKEMGGNLIKVIPIVTFCMCA